MLLRAVSNIPPSPPEAIHSCNDDSGGCGGGGDDEGDEGNGARARQETPTGIFSSVSAVSPSRSVITLMIPSCPLPPRCSPPPSPAFPFDRSFFVGRAGWRAAIFKWSAGLPYQRKGYQVMAIGMFADDSAILRGRTRRERAAGKRDSPRRGATEGWPKG